MPSYYKATRPDGTDWRTGTVDYAAALRSGEPLTHPGPLVVDDPSTYLSVSTVPTDCTGMEWPCRLFVVEPNRCRPHRSKRWPHKRCLRSLRVVEERPAHEALGPQGEEVAAIIERARRLTYEETGALDAAWAAAWDAAWAAAWAAAGAAARAAARAAAGTAAWAAAWDAARDAAGAAAWDAAWAAAWDAARDAAGATLTRDLIGKHGYTQVHHDLLMGPWREVIEDG